VSIVLGFAGLIAGVLVCLLAISRLTTKPWEAAEDAPDPTGVQQSAPARIGLWVFLAVVTSLFALFIAAYGIRMSPHLPQGAVLRDWRPLAEPPVLWLNTLLLFAGSAGMQVARAASRRGEVSRTRAGLIAGGVFAFAFLAGQWLAWRQLQSAGLYAATNPANAFFYVLTAVHGLHLVGGLAVWMRTLARTPRGPKMPDKWRLTVELCTVYWHYLLAVWLVLFGLLLLT
jgi:cytochrome c oxidase subunit 3